MTFEITGVIDRVDRLATRRRTFLVFDYKSSTQKFNVARAAAGIDMQLLLYALAVE